MSATGTRGGTLYEHHPNKCSFAQGPFMTTTPISWQGVLDAANAETFDGLAEYAFEKHSNPHKRRRTGGRQRMVATALAVAGSINAADHSETFPSLAECLRSKVSVLVTSRGQNLDRANSN